ncbi:uncharacterized protein ATNIH1004_011804 [Aspergillus tanneri]|uniref:Uncharacterized protein n=1 Tax=Aspergillus tanneri TaxID=1220188 RepID=A0A5M9M4H9_9EURO|nr:uncharacterized protein ATNIH1004_011804 [Aspergillus tanneri]KAA8641668.1 hypothetical protein ATNIH1004_011804 [Aspergillus tanneri]
MCSLRQEEQRLREQAERSQIEEQRRREEEQRQREQAERPQIEEQRLREQAEEQLKLQTQETTLPGFLDACHVHLFLGLSIQKDKDSSTKGDPVNADRKLRPTKIRGKEARERMGSDGVTAHLTALGQVLAFTLRALRDRHGTSLGQPRQYQTKTWEMVYDDLLDEIAEKDIPSSDFKHQHRVGTNTVVHPHKDQVKVCYRCVLRQPRELHVPQPSASSSLAVVEKSPGSRSKGKSQQYCTQQCLLGLIKGGELDWKCPNVSDHGID